MSLERKKMSKFFALTSLLCFVFLFSQRYEIIELKKEKVLLERLNETNKLRIEKQQKELEEITVQLMILSVLSGISEEQSSDCSFPKQKK